MEYRVKFYVNDAPVELTVPANRTLLSVLRDDLALTGTKEGCGAGECGACTVIVDGLPLNACLVLAPEMDGMHITTIEGLSKDGELSPLQKAFVEHAALQCGFCTPGFIMTAVEILETNRLYTDDELRKLLSGHLCRCTGYENILRAVKKTMYRRLGLPLPE